MAALTVAVLGLHHKGGLRVQRRGQAEQLGGQGATARGGAAGDAVPGRQLGVLEQHLQPANADDQQAAVRAGLLLNGRSIVSASARRLGTGFASSIHDGLMLGAYLFDDGLTVLRQKTITYS